VGVELFVGGKEAVVYVAGEGNDGGAAVDGDGAGGDGVGELVAVIDEGEAVIGGWAEKRTLGERRRGVLFFEILAEVVAAADGAGEAVGVFVVEDDDASVGGDPFEGGAAEVVAEFAEASLQEFPDGVLRLEGEVGGAGMCRAEKTQVAIASLMSAVT
jgi:hypothetical protein